MLFRVPCQVKCIIFLLNSAMILHSNITTKKEEDCENMDDIDKIRYNQMKKTVNIHKGYKGSISVCRSRMIPVRQTDSIIQLSASVISSASESPSTSERSSSSGSNASVSNSPGS